MDTSSLDSITNRHIAKLPDDLKPFNLPAVAEREVIRRMHFLKEDISLGQGTTDKWTG